MAESAVWNIQLHYQSSTSVFFFRPPRPSPKRLPTGTPWGPTIHKATSNNDIQRQQATAVVGPMFCKDLYSTIIADMTWYDMLLPFWNAKWEAKSAEDTRMVLQHPDAVRFCGCLIEPLPAAVAIQNDENIPQTILTISTPNECVVLPRNTIEDFDDFSSTGTSHSHCCEVCNTNRMAAEAAWEDGMGNEWHGGQ